MFPARGQNGTQGRFRMGVALKTQNLHEAGAKIV